MAKSTKLIRAAALVVVTPVAFLTSHQMGQAFRHGDWAAVAAWALALVFMVWVWFKAEKKHG